MNIGMNFNPLDVINIPLQWEAARQQKDAINETNKRNMEMNRENQVLQKEFAQMGIQWKVRDAYAAGIHPLYALGAQTHSFSPQSIGYTPNTAMAEGLANMGQNISRAVNVTTNQDTRQSQLLDLQLEGAAIDNDIRRTELIERQNRLIPGPAMPSPTDSHVIPGQGNSYKLKKAEITAAQPGNPAQAPAAVTDYGLTRTRSGGYAVVPSKDVKELIEDQFVPETEWALRNRLVPILAGHKPPDPKHYPLPKGYDRWEWQPLVQEFRAVDSYGNVQGMESGSWKWKLNRKLKGGK